MHTNQNGLGGKHGELEGAERLIKASEDFLGIDNCGVAISGKK